jgi:hypothetical protein
MTKLMQPLPHFVCLTPQNRIPIILKKKVILGGAKMILRLLEKAYVSIKRLLYASFLVFLFLLVVNCASSKLTQVTGTIPRGLTIALAPSGGVLADAIGIELFNRGFTVIDTNQMSNLMVRYNMTEIEFSKPQNLEVLQENGIDGILMVKSVAGYDNKPQSATVRLNSTKKGGEMIVGVSWQNGWGGRVGSIMDRSMRKDIAGAAKEIVTALLARTRPRE